FRERSRKFIYHAEAKNLEMFDLSVDPHESHDLAAEDKKAADEAKEIILAWVQSQNKHIEDLLSGSQPLTPVSAAPTVKVMIYASGTKYLNPPTAQVLIDGENAGYFSAKSAPSNSQRAVGDDEISATIAPFEFSSGQNQCPRKIELRFLNDEWE